MFRIGVHVAAFCIIGLISGTIFGICAPADNDIDEITAQPGLRLQHNTRQKRYSYYLEKPKWEKAELTWNFNPINLPNNVTETNMRSLIEKALNMWAEPSGLKFQEILSNSDADIQISFVKPNHKVESETCDTFDNVMVSHGFAPYDSPFKGQLHINSEASYSTSEEPGKYNLFPLLLHELGHILGMSHSDVKKFPLPIMGNVYQQGGSNLQQDDIDGIKALYKDVHKSRRRRGIRS